MLIFVLILIIVGGGVWFVKGGLGAESSDDAAVFVEVIEAVPGDITTKVSADGNIKAAETKEIKTKINSFVEEIYVEEGDIVEPKDKIARMQDYGLKDNLEELEFKLKEAEINYSKNYEQYLKQDKLNKLKIEEAEKNLEIAISSKEKEKINLNTKKESVLEKIKKYKISFQKAEKKLKDNKYLYYKGAITKNTLEEFQNSYTNKENDLNSARRELRILNEQTIPNAMKLADLKISNSKNNVKLVKYNIEKEKINKEDLDLIKIKIRRLENNIIKSKKELEDVVVQSPYKGTIIATKFSKDSKVIQGDIIVTLADVNDLIAEVYVDEIDINQVNIGQKVILKSDSFPKEIKGKVDYVAPVSTKVGNINKYITEIKLDKPEEFLRVGMFLNAEITTASKKNVITLPSMVILGEEEKYVFVFKNNTAVKRPVELGLQSISQVEVKGIEKGEKIVSGPFNLIRKLEDGAAVRYQ